MGSAWPQRQTEDRQRLWAGQGPSIDTRLVSVAVPYDAFCKPSQKHNSGCMSRS